MNLFELSKKNLKQDVLESSLSILLIAISFALISIVWQIQQQADESLKKQIKNIDMVIGAKGSPLQLILSAVYHVDKPTGNISAKEAQKIQTNPLVAESIPLSYGDNVSGFRIVGTQANYLEWYDAKFDEGQLWNEVYEIVVGFDVAEELNLSIGDSLISSHGLAGSLEQHQESPYIVKGILEKNNSPLDRLIMTALESVWMAHEEHDLEEMDQTEVHEHKDDHEHEEGNSGRISKGSVHSIYDDDQEFTAVLIRFRNLAGMMQLPRLVNEKTSMQAAVPTFELDRLLNLLGNGAVALQLVGLIILVMAGISLFIQLHRSFRKRRYELALLRIYGASSNKLILVILFEAIQIAFWGSSIGWGLAKLIAFALKIFPVNALISYPNFDWLIPAEFYLILSIITLSLIACLIPILQTYRMDISTTLSNNTTK